MQVSQELRGHVLLFILGLKKKILLLSRHFKIENEERFNYYLQAKTFQARDK